jgi:selenium-binding protein 1
MMLGTKLKLLTATALALVAAVGSLQALLTTRASARAARAAGEGTMVNMPRMPPMDARGATALVTRAAMMGDMNMAGTHYLYVWVGDAARRASDRLAAIDFRRNSRDYGKVVGWALVPGPGGVDNEPHHCMIAMSMRMIACGGLLSVLRHQPGLFFFDVSNPAHPRYMFSRQPMVSAVTDDLRPLPDGGFLVTDLGSASGGTPGRVVELNARMQITHEWPTNPPPGFNPHGISISWNHNLMLTSDLFDPASTLNVTPGPVVFRGTVRVWNFDQRRIIRTITVPGAPGMMDVKFIPHDPGVRAYTAGVNNGLLYLLNPIAGTERPVFDLNTIDSGASPQVMVLSPDGRRLFIPMDSRRGSEIVMLDITNPVKPRLLDALELGAAGPHDSLLTRDHRLVMSDYFLNEDGFGKVHVDGDHRVRVFLVGQDSLRPDPRFKLDFDHAIPGLRLRPHGTDAL